MPKKLQHNTPSHYFSNENFDKLLHIIEHWITKPWNKIFTFDEKQKDTLTDLFNSTSQTIQKKKVLDFGLVLLEAHNYYTETWENNDHMQRYITSIKSNLIDIFNDTALQKEIVANTSRDLSTKKYYSIEFSKWHFAFQTIHSVLKNELPWFSICLTNKNQLWLIPNDYINTILFSNSDEWKILEDYICKVNIAYEEIKSDIDLFIRYSINSWIHWIPSITDWREFYLATALYQNLYSHIKVYQESLESAHDEETQSNIQRMQYHPKNIEDIIDIRNESFLEWLIIQIKQAYLWWEDIKLRECKNTLRNLWKEVGWEKLAWDLNNLCKMYQSLAIYIKSIKDNYWDNKYYSIRKHSWEDSSFEETIEENNIMLQDELWFFRHKKFIARREFWNNIVKKVFHLQKIEDAFYDYLTTL